MEESEFKEYLNEMQIVFQEDWRVKDNLNIVMNLRNRKVYDKAEYSYFRGNLKFTNFVKLFKELKCIMEKEGIDYLEASKRLKQRTKDILFEEKN